MAERLPRYRPLGVAIPSVPGVDFTRAAQAEGRVFETLSDALNKMSDFAFERQKAETIRKAEQYAFNNPISKEQLEEAKKRGIDLDDVVGDPDTVFGATVRSTTGKIMSAQLETLYRKELAIIQRNMENPLYDPEDEETGVAAQTKKLAGLEQGYAEAIAEVDTDEAIAFKAGIAALGGSAYKTALEIRNKKISAGLMVVAKQSMDDLPANARGVIADFAGDDKMLSVDDALENLRIGVEKTLMITGNPDFIKSNSAAIDGVFQQAKIDILTNHALSEEFSVTDTQRDRKISTGDFGRYSTVFASLGAKEQAQVRQNVRAEMAARDTTLERVRRDNIRVFQEEVAVIVRDADGATDDQFDAAIGKLYRISSQTAGEAITFQAIEALKKEREEGTPSNPSGNVNLALAIANGQVTHENFPDAIEHFGVTYKDALSMVSKASAVDKNDLKQATLLARRTAGVLDELTTTYTSQQATQITLFMNKVEKEFAKQLQDWKDAGSVIGDRPTRMAIAIDTETLVFNSEVQGQVEEALQVANDMLQGISNFPITESTTDAEIDTLPFDPNANLSQREKDNTLQTLKSQLRKIRDLIKKRNDILR